MTITTSGRPFNRQMVEECTLSKCKTGDYFDWPDVSSTYKLNRSVPRDVLAFQIL